MKWFDKFLSLIGLQRKIKSLKQIQQENCEHEWMDNASRMSVLYYTDTAVYCPKCDKERIVSYNLKDRLLKMTELKKEYEKNKQLEFDKRFDELR